MQDSMIGVGSALRKARERRGITLDAASRDTKLHIDQLRALEAEDFEALLGDVYVRGSLRTYSQYLGLSPDKVVAAYDRHAERRLLLLLRRSSAASSARWRPRASGTTSC